MIAMAMADHKTIADFRKDNGLALRKVCARFVELCREMGLLATASHPNVRDGPIGVAHAVG
jgi:hypothetical protein